MFAFTLAYGSSSSFFPLSTKSFLGLNLPNGAAGLRCDVVCSGPLEVGVLDPSWGLIPLVDLLCSIVDCFVSEPGEPCVCPQPV